MSGPRANWTPSWKTRPNTRPARRWASPVCAMSEDRANVIAYLDQTDGDTYEIELPEDRPRPATPVRTAEETRGRVSRDGNGHGNRRRRTADGGCGRNHRGIRRRRGRADMAEADKPPIRRTEAGQSRSEGSPPRSRPPTRRKARSVSPVPSLPRGRQGTEPRRAAPGEPDRPRDRQRRRLQLFRRAEGFGGGWTVDELNAWLEDPRGLRPVTG